MSKFQDLLIMNRPNEQQYGLCGHIRDFMWANVALGRQRLAATVRLTDPKPKVLGLRLANVDGQNFYTEDGILSLETGATASIQVSITNDIGDITHSQ